MKLSMLKSFKEKIKPVKRDETEIYKKQAKYN